MVIIEGGKGPAEMDKAVSNKTRRFADLFLFFLFK